MPLIICHALNRQPCFKALFAFHSVIVVPLSFLSHLKEKCIGGTDI
jgi:hypothetical protein